MIKAGPTTQIAAQPAVPQVQIRQAAAGVHITVAGTGATTWPTGAIGSTEIPARLVVVGTAHNILAPPISSTLDCRPWAGQFRARPRPIPEVGGPARLDLAPPPTTIPTEPITLLRKGQSRGQSIQVWTVAGSIEHAGQRCQLTRLDALLPGANLIDESTSVSAIAGRPTSPPGANPAAQRQSLRVQVRAAGMQRISGADLALGGASRVHFDPAQLQLHRAGQEVALQIIGGADGRLDAGDELRLYAPDPGDRWNTTDTYWLTYAAQPGRRIELRDSSSGTAPQRTPGLVAGRWQPRTIYDSTRPGPDGDHWFADTLHSGPDQEVEAITIPLTTTLPIATGSVTIALSGTATTPGPHQVTITAGITTASASWQGMGDWTQTITLDTTATTATIALLPAAAADQLLLDRVQWTRPVDLAVDERGATFQAEAGSWRYQLGDLADDPAFYDVTEPA